MTENRVQYRAGAVNFKFMVRYYKKKSFNYDYFCNILVCNKYFHLIVRSITVENKGK